ncbi:MAG: hypothetical protein LBG84_01790 [Treponema sp.]|jgi:outer membrane protein assembly factor BamD (BamD/ComL family)|nr:hypothetical protein [Treponema sp.]
MKAVIWIPAVLLLAACASTKVEIPEDTPPAKLIQKAQEASDTNKYKTALRYYQTLLEWYGDSAEYLCTAEYEIAFIRYKQRRYNEARSLFESLLSLYSRAEAAGTRLPPQFKILSEKVLARITELGH